MRIADLLRKLADEVDADERNDRTGVGTTDQAPEGFNAQAGTGESPDGTMVPPLQQILVLLQKATGVEYNVDQCADGVPDMDVLHKMIEVNSFLFSKW